MLADEERRHVEDLRQHRRERDAAELEAGETVDVGRHERRARGRDLAQKTRIGLEHVLVEVLVADDARPQRERAGDVRGVVDAGGEMSPSRVACVHRVGR